MNNWFYDLPTYLSLFIFVMIVTALSLMGLFLFDLADLELVKCEDNNNVVGIYITIVSAFLGIVLTFIVVAVWGDYADAQVNADREAYSLYSLFETISFLPGTEETQRLIIRYMEEIVEVEYPTFKAGDIPPISNRTLTALQEFVYSYNPTNDRENTLYSQSLDQLTTAVELRIDRFASATQGINFLVAAVTIIDSILIVILCWFLSCRSAFHYLLVAVIAIYVASALFLIYILGYPFRGYASLPPLAFEEALKNIFAVIAIV